jgi:uncharacterized membrane protein
MTTTRLEAFSDGVIAILITIMILELKIPHGDGAAALQTLAPSFVAYVLSFIILGIYWNNHHHLLHATQEINGPILWANLHLLFWLSLIPATTAWIGENHNSSVPAAVYGVVLVGAALAYTLLSACIVSLEGNERVAHAIGSDRKGKLSLFLYVSAVCLAFLHPFLADAIYIAVAMIWLVPDRRIEQEVGVQRA